MSPTTLNAHYTIHIIVGKPASPNNIPQHSHYLLSPIAQRSPYLRTLINPPPPGIPTCRLELPDVDPQAFKLYIWWLSVASFPFPPSDQNPTDEKTLSWKQCYPLVAAYLLGSRFQDAVFQGCVIGELERWLAREQDPDREVLDAVFGVDGGGGSLMWGMVDRLFGRDHVHAWRETYENDGRRREDPEPRSKGKMTISETSTLRPTESGSSVTPVGTEKGIAISPPTLHPVIFQGPVVLPREKEDERIAEPLAVHKKSYDVDKALPPLPLPSTLHMAKSDPSAAQLSSPFEAPSEQVSQRDIDVVTRHMDQKSELVWTREGRGKHRIVTKGRSVPSCFAELHTQEIIDVGERD